MFVELFPLTTSCRCCRCRCRYRCRDVWGYVCQVGDVCRGWGPPLPRVSELELNSLRQFDRAPFNFFRQYVEITAAVVIISCCSLFMRSCAGGVLAALPCLVPSWAYGGSCNPPRAYFPHRQSHSLCGVVWFPFSPFYMFSRANKSSFYRPAPHPFAGALTSKIQYHVLHEDRDRRPTRVVFVPQGLCARDCAVSGKCSAQVCRSMPFAT